MFKFFENLVDPFAPYKENAHPPQKVFAFLWEYLRGFRNVFIFTGVLSVATSLIEVWLIAYIGRLVDIMSDTGRDAFWGQYGLEMILVALFILILRPLVQTVHVMMISNTLMPNVATIVRYRAHRHVLGQSVGWFENDFAGRIANRVMQAPPAAGHVVFQIFDALTFAVAYVIGAAILLAQSDVRLVIPLLLWLIGYCGLMYWTVVRIGPASQAFADARSQVTGLVVDAYTNIHTVKMFSHHDEELKQGTKAIEHARIMFQREMRLYVIMDVGLNVINGALMVGVTGWAMWLWLQGSAPLGLVIAATTLTVRMNGMSGWIMWAVTSFFSELGVVREGMQTISAPITMRDAPKAPALKFDRGAVEFRNVAHHYGRETGGLSGIDLDLKPGEKLGLVGHSGAGKSTLVKLLLRFYEVEEGQILIDGQDIKTVQQNSLREHIGVVQQDSSLLHRSIHDNISYGRPSASKAEVIAAAKQAEAHEFILELEDTNGNRGYDAHVGERGVKLSGGQRQRITLARVILKDAPILILDEATSALDSTVEASIQNTLYNMMDGKTVIAIAHRLSTIAKMDRIVVMDDGKIIEQGTHAQLLQKQGHYAQFWAHQSDMDRKK